MQAVTSLVDAMSAELGLRIYSFSVWHIFFEQYLTIAKDSLHILGVRPSPVQRGRPHLPSHWSHGPRAKYL